MFVRQLLRSPYAVLVVFFGVAAVSTTALGWLVSQQLQQDRTVRQERQRERSEQAADAAVARMQRGLRELEALLRGRDVPAVLPSGLSLALVGPQETIVRPAGSLPYVPKEDGRTAVLPRSISNAERLEFQEPNSDLSKARQAYASLATSADSVVRAAALLRLGRVERRLGLYSNALRTYDELATLPAATLNGLPAALIARVGRIETYDGMRDTAAVREEADKLRRDLITVRWSLRQPEYEFYLREAHRRLGTSTAQDSDGVARAAAVMWVWRNRLAMPDISNQVAVLPEGHVWASWTNTQDGLRIISGGPVFLSRFLSDTVPQGYAVTLTSRDGLILCGPSPPPKSAVIRTQVESGLPWTLFVVEVTSPATQAERRSLLFAVFAIVALVTLTGGYFITRSIHREMEVSRMQSGFIAAVSHEFRTPLTAMLQMSQMLVSHRFRSIQMRQRSYEVLVRESERLRQLVEELLDFGRFERADRLRRERLNVSSLVRDTVADFQQHVADAGYQVELATPADDVFVAGDREALIRALWNLLDNAVKYSPACHTVWVDVCGDVSRVRITVRDQGLGIPPAEQDRVFARFVRGEQSSARGIRGTGIGLAIVREIVMAHGGKVRLTSNPGQGSNFTMELSTYGGAA